jgi:hypothetical protein
LPAASRRAAAANGNFIVSVNGRPSRYFRVNHAVKGVVIPSAGDWEVVFEYRPARWRVSWILAGVVVAGRAYHAGTSDQRVDERLQGAIQRRLGFNVDLPRLEDKQH